MFNLTNKRILIAGGSSGIGLAVASMATKHGADVVIASRNAPDKADYLRGIIGKDVRLYSADVSDRESVRSLFIAVGNIDHLVVTVRPDMVSAPFMEVDLNMAKSAFDTKFWGQFTLVREAVNFIAKDGSITLTGGIAGEKIYRGSTVMAIINSATETLCRSLAVELAPLRVNVISPGFVEPKPEKTREYARGFPAGRLAFPDEIATAYLAVMTNPYQTGTVTVIDGGARLI